MNCIICGEKTKGKRKTCSDECLHENSSRMATARRKAGITKGINFSGRDRKPYNAKWHGTYER